jgi:predicted HD phosphohydrolase
MVTEEQPELTRETELTQEGAFTLAGLVDLLESLGAVAGEDEGLSELDHGLQCAYELSLARPDDEELQIAGLVHDIGHRLASDEQHGRVGGERVRPLLGDRVAGLVEAHVPAKRYLVTTDASYGSVLTSGSVVSLARQGGPLTSEELAEFESGPYATDAVVLRRADDAAKVPGRIVPSLEDWLPVLRRLAQ